MTRVDELFEAERKFRQLEDDIFNAIFKIMELPDILDGPWPFDHRKFDDYDSSFELDDVAADFRMKPEWLPKFWEMGWRQLWLNHVDGTETHYYEGGKPEGSRKDKAGRFMD